MAIIKLGKDNFDDVISQNKILVIDFWAEWCGPCKAFSQTYEDVANKYPDLMFAKVDIDQDQELATDFNVRSIPHLVVMKEDVVIFSESGVLPNSALTDLVDQALVLDLTQVHHSTEEEEKSERKE